MVSEHLIILGLIGLWSCSVTEEGKFWDEANIIINVCDMLCAKVKSWRTRAQKDGGPKPNIKGACLLACELLP